MAKQKYLISIIGPTAIGKTSLSIAVANHFKTDIVSADSRQFYKEMHIGTAAPSVEELAAAPHHFIHHKSISEDYNVGTFEKDALQKLDQLFKTKSCVVLVGGSGLYIDSVTRGLDSFPEVDPSIREQLNADKEIHGMSYLQDKLKSLDLTSYETIAIDNPHRVIRALEISIGSGRPYSSFLNKDKTNRPFKTITIGITADRTIIYERINNRVDTMMRNGLIDEVRRLEPLRHLNALNTVGYTELFKYLSGEWTLEFAISEIKKNSRRFAKRQLTWFKKNEQTHWIDYQTSLEDVLQTITQEMKK